MNSKSVNNLCNVSVSSRLAAALESTSLHVSVLSVRASALGNGEHFHVNCHRLGQTPSDFKSAEVITLYLKLVSV